MTSKEILTELYETTDGRKWDKALDKIEQYANQRVIEELDKLRKQSEITSAGYVVYSILIDQRIKELKKEK